MCCIILCFKVVLIFYTVVDKKVINQHHVQNRFVICIFKLGDTITCDWCLLYSKAKKSGFQFNFGLLAVGYVEHTQSELLIVWPYQGANETCEKQPFPIRTD